MADWKAVIRLGAITKEDGDLKMVGRVTLTRGSSTIDVKVHAPYDPLESVQSARHKLIAMAHDVLNAARDEVPLARPSDLELLDEPSDTHWG